MNTEEFIKNLEERIDYIKSSSGANPYVLEQCLQKIKELQEIVDNLIKSSENNVKEFKNILNLFENNEINERDSS